MRPVAIDALNRHLGLVGNPSALHVAGQRARRVMEEARETLAAALGAHPSEVVFTSGGSEANSIAVLGSAAARPERGHVVISAIEHPSVAAAAQRGAEALPVTRQGVVELDEAPVFINERCSLVSTMTVNNETGIVQPISQLRDLAQNGGAWFHTDAVQAVGHLEVDFAASGFDLMSVSAHKLGGPVGIGALVVKRNVTPSPIGLGGGQERELRSGTLPVALAASFAAAAAEAVAQLPVEIPRLGALQQQLFEILGANQADINNVDVPSAPHIVSATFEGLRANDLLFLLDQAGIYASVGSACRAGVHQPSEVMLAMGRDSDQASATLRFSIGHTSNSADLELLAARLPDCVAQARKAW